MGKGSKFKKATTECGVPKSLKREIGIKEAIKIIGTIKELENMFDDVIDILDDIMSEDEKFETYASGMEFAEDDG